MENCLNKAELLEKFNLCYDSLNKILNYLKLPFEIKISANYKKVPYYNQESINKIEEFLKDKSSNDVANFFRNLARLRKGYSIPMIAEELKCDRERIEKAIKILNLHFEKGKQNYYTEEDKNKIQQYSIENPIIKPKKNKQIKSKKLSEKDEILLDYYNKGIELISLAELAKFLGVPREVFSYIAKSSGCKFYKIKNINYLDSNESQNQIDLSPYFINKYKRENGLPDYEGYTLLSKLTKELKLTNIPFNYCNYLDIEIFHGISKTSGHDSYYILDEDCDKLKEFVETHSVEERKSICTKFTNNLIYGCDNVFQNEEIKEICKNSKIERFGSLENAYKFQQEKLRENLLKTKGVENVFQLEEVKEKSENTKIEKYGSLENYKAHQANKTKATKLERYGDENYVNREKIIETNMEKYGVPNAMQNEEVKNKAKKTNLLKYGFEASSCNEEVKDKIRNAWMEKSEDEIKEIMRKHYHKWSFDDIQFDSKWEIYYYFYLKNNNIKFKMQVPLEYEYKNKKYRYFCDFYLIDSNEYVEIKNPKCLNENGNLKVAYPNDNQSKLDAKTKCMKEHNVKIISKKEIKPFIDYFKKNCIIPIIDNRTKKINTNLC